MDLGVTRPVSTRGDPGIVGGLVKAMMVDSSRVLVLDVDCEKTGLVGVDADVELRAMCSSEGRTPDGSGLSGKKYVMSGRDDVEGELIRELCLSNSVIEGTESLRSPPGKTLKSETEMLGEAREFGGPRLRFESREKSELLGTLGCMLENFDVARDEVLRVLRRFLACASFVLAALTDSGTPSHLELTLGTVDGSFCCEMAFSPIVLTFFSAACLRCCSANSSSAFCEGSFNVRKPSMPLAFFFFAVFESLELEALELDARLCDVVKLRVSKVVLMGEEMLLELVVDMAVDGRWSGSASVERDSELEVF
jgi:hypothetical protein